MTGAADRQAAEAGERLAAAYQAIAARCRDLPIYNRALTVEAVGFRAHDGAAIGVLVTPWFMNLVAIDLPGGPARTRQPAGSTVRHSLPAGGIDFIVAEVTGIGRVDAASLFSPMFAFDDPAVARATASAALEAALKPDVAAAPATVQPPVPGRRGLLFGHARPGGGP
jgi:[NiFe] hydrogenase assembly HybE family chaperone